MARMVTRWEAEDGKVFKTEEEADAHDAALDFYKWCHSEFRGGEFGPDMIARGILESWDVTRKKT